MSFCGLWQYVIVVLGFISKWEMKTRGEVFSTFGKFLIALDDNKRPTLPTDALEEWRLSE